MRNALVLLMAQIALSCCSGAFAEVSESKPAESKPKTILALGDSYTIGQSVAEAERFPVQLAKMLQKEGIPTADPRIIARTGWTTDELADAIKSAAPKGPFDLVTLLIGVNNQFRGRSEDEYKTQFAELLKQSIEFAGGDASHVIVFSIPDWGVTPFANGRDGKKIAAEIDRFNAINKDAATKAKVHYVDITPESRQAATDATLVARDGLHPSGTMYTEWCKLALEPAKTALKK